MTLPDFCTYLMDESTKCNRGPVQADYVESTPLHGEKLIASLCEWHDRAEARRYAMAKGYERRSRKPVLEVLESA